NSIANSQARLLAGERRCRRMLATTRRAKGIIRMPTAITVPASAKLKDHAELNIQSLHGAHDAAERRQPCHDDELRSVDVAVAGLSPSRGSAVPRSGLG